MKRNFPNNEDQFTGYASSQQSYSKPSRFAKSLCVSNIGPQYSDDTLIMELQGTFQAFGDVQVKIAAYMGQRVAYLNFYEEKAANDAYDSFLAKNLVLFDRSVHIEPVRSNKSRPQRDNNVVDRSNDRYNQPKPSGQRRDADNKGFRYAHHLDRTPPEDDASSTRTLFIGNLDPSISKEEIIRVFSNFGVVLDVDIKYSGQTAGRNSQNPVCFAFLRYKTVDEAYAAKLGMSGQMLASHTCKIGYGKIVTSACLWVGNIAQSVDADMLSNEFAKFGKIIRFKLESNGGSEKFAIVLFESTETSVSAATKMRSYRFPNTNRRLRVDYIGPDEFDQYVGSPDTVVEVKPERDLSAIYALKQSASLKSVVSSLPRIWSGHIAVKSTLFPVDLHVFAGDGELVASPLANNSASVVKVGQRVPLTERHVDEMKRRCLLARSGYCVLLATASSENRMKKSQPIRPISVLSQYFQEKSSIGIFMLQQSQSQVVLCYVLPHCFFSEQVLTKQCESLKFDDDSCPKDDYLMMVCFRSAPLHA